MGSIKDAKAKIGSIGTVSTQTTRAWPWWACSGKCPASSWRCSRRRPAAAASAAAEVLAAKCGGSAASPPVPCPAIINHCEEEDRAVANDDDSLTLVISWIVQPFSMKQVTSSKTVDESNTSPMLLSQLLTPREKSLISRLGHCWELGQRVLD